MSKPCAIHKCGTGCRFSAKKYSTFRVPADVERFKEWLAVVPGLKQSQFVCERHFEKNNMASVLRTGLANFNPTGLLGGLCKLAPKRRNAVITQVSFISSREQRIGRPPRPPPFDWRNRTYNRWQYMVDPMEARFDDNTKIVVVEGLPGVGKNEFAKQLAHELEMKYIAPPTFDTFWVNPYGFDHRSLNPKLPENARFWDIQSFLENPKGLNTAAMQVGMFMLKVEQYIDALAEVLSTGSGVVIQRCPYSDSVFMEAMSKNGYVSKGALDYYRKTVLGTLPELMRPHLIIYLDAPISVIKDNIKKRNIPYEAKSTALTDQYLNDLDTTHKAYLREAAKHSHLLIYDWSKKGDVQVVVEGIEALDFENYDPSSDKFFDWRYDHIYLLKIRRTEYTTCKEALLTNIAATRFDVPEMLVSAEDSILIEQLLNEIPEEQYQPGFNPKYDKGVLWKLTNTCSDYFPRKELKKKQ